MTDTASAPPPGAVTELEPGLRSILAPNPGPMTHWGTHTFIVGRRRVAVVDPGPDSNAHLAAILAATRGETITDILITHAHLDHTALTPRLVAATGAKVSAFGPPAAGRAPLMQKLALSETIAGGEGVDRDFMPDQELREGSRIEGETWSLTALHTPGHFAGHLAFDTGSALLTGDHVMAWASSLVSPPDGSIADFRATSHRLKTIRGRRFFPSHGPEIADPPARLDWLIRHRQSREEMILTAMTSGASTLGDITRAAYTDIPARMLPAAARNVLAHLIDLYERKLIDAAPDLTTEARFHLRP